MVVIFLTTSYSPEAHQVEVEQWIHVLDDHAPNAFAQSRIIQTMPLNTGIQPTSDNLNSLYLLFISLIIQHLFPLLSRTCLQTIRCRRILTCGVG